MVYLHTLLFGVSTKICLYNVISKPSAIFKELQRAYSQNTAEATDTILAPEVLAGNELWLCECVRLCLANPYVVHHCATLFLISLSSLIELAFTTASQANLLKVSNSTF